MYEIEIFGSIVGEKTKPNQITMEEIRQGLKDADGGEVLLLINSGGGSVVNGNAILDEIDRYPSTVTAHIMGICGSMATQIASKCQSVSMNANALYMIHNPSGGVVGEAKDMERQANLLKSMKLTALVNYMAKTGLPEETISKMMDDTTYMTAQEALDFGFIDEVTDAVEMTAEFKEYIFEAEDVSEQAKAYFKKTNTEDEMSEETKEKGILEKIVSLIKGDVQEPVVEPVLEVEEEVVLEEPSIDFEMKFNELEVETTAKLEAHSVELASVKASHEEAIQAKDSEIADVVAKTESIVKAFAEEKLTCADVAKLLASDSSAEDVKSQLEDKEPLKITEVVSKEDIEDKVSNMWEQWMSLKDEDLTKAQKFFNKNEEAILNDKDK